MSDYKKLPQIGFSFLQLIGETKSQNAELRMQNAASIACALLAYSEVKKA